MNNIRNRVLAAGLVIIMVLSMFAWTTVYADAKASLSQTKVTIETGKTKTVSVRNAGDKVSWKVISGKKNISITRTENSLKITGKKSGKAKLQIKTGGRELTCTITVKDPSHTNAAGDTRIAVKSSNYSVIFQLNDSQAAKELYEQLPLTLKVENYSNNEKIFYPPKGLDTNGTPTSRGSKGSLAYYAPWGDVVMFYEAAGSASGLYELGTAVSGGDYISKLSGDITVSRAD